MKGNKIAYIVLGIVFVVLVFIAWLFALSIIVCSTQSVGDSMALTVK